MTYANLSAKDAKDYLEKELKQLKKFQSMKLSLDMSRGKPCTQQLDMLNDMFDVLDSKSNFKLESGIDARNYGCVEGIMEMRKLFADLFSVSASNVYVGDSSSLSIMYTLVQHGKQFGFGGNVPWNKLPRVKFICLTPGYDRHFAICQVFGIEMISVPLSENGVNIGMIEALVENDSSIKGIWCVPKYSNPTGITYSDDVVSRLANMKTASPDFRIFWDNAYCVHTLFKDEPLKNIIEAANLAGNPDRVFMFSSTSKITMSGAGVATLITSEANLKEFYSRIKYQTIGPNKVNQLMHFRFLKDVNNIKAIMEKHASILRPKFQTVYDTLEANFEPNDIVSWTKPNGGYFVSVDVLSGSAKRVIEIASSVGVKFTNAGATFPLGNDDLDKNIRIAPSYPPVDELKTAMEVFVTAIKISALENICNK